MRQFLKPTASSTPQSRSVQRTTSVQSSQSIAPATQLSLSQKIADNDAAIVEFRGLSYAEQADQWEVYKK